VSLIRNLYYEVKPLIPRGAHLAIRRALARRARAKAGDTWPILRKAGAPPAGWAGWPNEKKFAVVLTHDVEGSVGVNQTLELADLEESLGFRSSFNFVPEGEYRVSSRLRAELVQRGFEIGVHDLHHDGKLYRSQQAFLSAAQKINGYLRDWNSVGFRSAFMHHQLDWLHHLEIEYDMSTFDTDPFEPQPDGVETIFPFWRGRVVSDSPGDSVISCPGRQDGYVELPYTLVQDSTLFLFLGEDSTRIWKQKLEWIAKQGGMALVIIHPDYMQFGSKSKSGAYSSHLYSNFLSWLKEEFGGQFWHGLPKEVARLVAGAERNTAAVAEAGCSR
jgi:hypothetical protein